MGLAPPIVSVPAPDTPGDNAPPLLIMVLKPGVGAPTVPVPANVPLLVTTSPLLNVVAPAPGVRINLAASVPLATTNARLPLPAIDELPTVSVPPLKLYIPLMAKKVLDVMSPPSCTTVPEPPPC